MKFDFNKLTELQFNFDEYMEEFQEWVNGDDHSDKDFTDSWNGETSEDVDCEGEKEDLPKFEFRISFRKRPDSFVIFVYRTDVLEEYVVFASTIHCFWYAGTFIMQKEYHNMDKLGCVLKAGR